VLAYRIRSQIFIRSTSLHSHLLFIYHQRCMSLETEAVRWRISNPNSKRTPDFYKCKSRCLTLRKERLVSSLTQWQNSWFTQDTLYDTMSWVLQLTVKLVGVNPVINAQKILVWNPPNNRQKKTEKDRIGW